MTVPLERWKAILVGIAAITSILTISIHGIAFADPQYCDRPGWPLCYSVGFDNGKANPGTSCPSGHSKNYCRGTIDNMPILGYNDTSPFDNMSISPPETHDNMSNLPSLKQQQR